MTTWHMRHPEWTTRLGLAGLTACICFAVTLLFGALPDEARNAEVRTVVNNELAGVRQTLVFRLALGSRLGDMQNGDLSFRDSFLRVPSLLSLRVLAANGEVIHTEYRDRQTALDDSASTRHARPFFAGQTPGRGETVTATVVSPLGAPGGYLVATFRRHENNAPLSAFTQAVAGSLIILIGCCALDAVSRRRARSRAFTIRT